MTPEQQAKLPKWAQDELRILRMRLEEAKASISQLEGATSDQSRIQLRNIDEAPRFLRDRSHISYTLPNGQVDVWFDNSERLCVTATSGMGDTLVILPNANNSITVEVR